MKINQKIKFIFLTITVFLVGFTGCGTFFQKKATPESELTKAINHYERGLKLEQTGNPEAAIAEYNQANKISPRPAAYYHLGLIYAAKAEYPLAISHFEKALELAPTFAAAKQERDRIKSLPH